MKQEEYKEIIIYLVKKLMDAEMNEYIKEEVLNRNWKVSE